MTDDERPSSLTRRAFVAAAGTVAASTAVAPGAAALTMRQSIADVGALPARSVGSGGTPTCNATLGRLAREYGRGEPLMFVDLAAVDQNAEVIVNFARRHPWSVRPALKMGYPPTRGELQAYLGSAQPRGQRRHRLTLLASSVEILQDMARLARTTHRPLPLDVGLEFDSGEGRAAFTTRSRSAMRSRCCGRSAASCCSAPCSVTTVMPRPPPSSGAQGRRPVSLDGIHQGAAATHRRRGILPEGLDVARSGRHPPGFVYPPRVQDDRREGGRCMVYAPPGELNTSDYVLCWPNQGGDGIDYFGALPAVRGGRVLDVWPTFTRWGTFPVRERCAQ